MSQRCFDDMMSILKDVLPENNKFSSNFYQGKRLVQGLGIEYRKFDVCPNFCMLYYKENEGKDVCDECKLPRYESAKPNKKKGCSKRY
jgi:hypothetical protein